MTKTPTTAPLPGRSGAVVFVYTDWRGQVRRVRARACPDPVAARDALEQMLDTRVTWQPVI